jgi:cyanophycinase
MELTKAQGRLMAIGGGEDKENDCRVLKEFVRLIGDEKANLVVMTTATNKPEEVAEEYIDVFKRLGVKKIQAIDVSRRADAMHPESIEAIKEATGLYFTGGNQLHITSLMGGTELQKIILERYRKDLIIGGTSAGAAMMGNSMIISGDSNENPRSGGVEIAPGTDLIIGCMIDTHFSQRGRHGRLLAAVAHYPQDFGFGIDENTAMIVDKDHFTVFGEGAVTVIDGGAMTYTDVPYCHEGESIALADVRIHVLSDGYKFDFKTRKMIPPKESQYKVKKASLNENGKHPGK